MAEVNMQILLDSQAGHLMNIYIKNELERKTASMLHILKMNNKKT